MTAIALAIAGSDSGGGAGIQADLKTFSALGVYGATALTALTAQNTRGVRAIHALPAAFVAAQAEAVCDDFAVAAVKVGMLADADIVRAVARCICERGLANVVVDPVMVAASGDRLLRDDAVCALREELLPLADLVTPNLPEAGVLLDSPPPATVEEMAEAARGLVQLGCKAALVKGGHLGGADSPDVFHAGAGAREFTARRINTANTHGTGCTLSSAITARLATGAVLVDAIADARDYLHAALAAADGLGIGGGGDSHGPVHHFHRWWRP